MDVQTLGNCTVEMDVFTIGFRKVYSQKTQVQSANGGTTTTLQWNLNDDSNRPVSNGLYYILVRITGNQPMEKTLKVLILR